MAETAEGQSGSLSITAPPEGQLLAIVKGNPEGPLDMFVASIAGWHFKYQEYTNDPADIQPDELDDWEKWELVPNKDPKTGCIVFSPTKKGMWEEEFATIFVGPGKALRISKTLYAKWEKKPGSTKTDLVEKNRNDSPFFYFQYNLAIPADKVEIKGNFTIDPLVNLLVRTRNPYITEFLAGGWESLLNAAVQAKIREYAGRKNFNQLRGEHEQGNTGLVHAIISLNDNAPSLDISKGKLAKLRKLLRLRPNDGLIKKIGIEILDVRFVKFDIASTQKSITEALVAQEVNRLNADAALEKKREIVTLAEGESAAAEKMRNAYGSGEAAAMVRAAEVTAHAIEHTSAEFVSINSPGVSAAVPINRKPKQNQQTTPTTPNNPRPRRKSRR